MVGPYPFRPETLPFSGLIFLAICPYFSVPFILTQSPTPMEALHKFSGETEAAIWQQIADDMAKQEEILEYAAQIEFNGREVFFDIDIDLGGGFEGGFETTTFAAPLMNPVSLRFQIHPQDWINELGKLLGVEDVELGYPEFDKAFIIKTNEKDKLKNLFADESLRESLKKYDNFELQLAHDTETSTSPLILSFSIDKGITNPTDLQDIFHFFYALLLKVDIVILK
jgi:hypothetical protein